MLSVAAIGGSGTYYLKLAREDYYLEGGEPLGRWWGKGAERIVGLGTVQKEDLKALLKGFSPDREPLTQNAGKDHQAGWDLTFSAPKSVSVLWSQADEATRRIIQAAHYKAVKAALDYLQDEIVYTRRGKGGHIHEKAGLVVATFEHGTSRELDPNLHLHALVQNVCIRDDGTTGTIVSKPIYQAKMTMGALYRADFSCTLTQELGVRCEQEERGDSFAIAGVPKKLCEDKSKRRDQVKDKLKSYGSESAAAAAAAARETRKPKEEVPPRSELFAQWKKDGEAFGFDASTVLNREVQERNLGKEFRKALSKSLEQITESESHFTEKQLLHRVAVNAQGRGLNAHEIRNRVKEELGRRHGEIVALGIHDGEARYATRTAFRCEQQLIESAARLAANTTHGASEKVIDRGIKVHGAHLEAEQREAVQFLTRKGGGFRSLEGLPGTGKTTTLSVVREILEDAGYRVIGATLSAKASRELTKTGKIESHTIAYLKKKTAPAQAPAEESMIGVLKHEAKQLGRAFIGKDRDDPLKPGDIVDPQSLGDVLKHEARQIGRAVLGKERDDRALNAGQTIDPQKLGDVLKHEAKQVGRALLGKDRNDGPLHAGNGIDPRRPGDVLKHEAKQLGRAILGKDRDDRPLHAANRIDPNKLGDVLKHEAKQLGRALIGKDRDDRPLKAGQRTGLRGRQKSIVFDSTTVLVIDESAMVATNDFVKLTTAVEKAGGMVVSVFDRQQLQAIGPGGAAAFLADRLGKADLQSIVRQNEEWMRDAARQFYRGDAEAALKQYEAAGRLHVAEDRERAITKLVTDWASKERGQREGSLIFVGTRLEVTDVNERCQSARLNMGEFHGKPLSIRDQEFYSGDRVLFTENSKKLGVDNGTLGTIIGVQVSKAIVTVKIDHDQTVHVPLKSYKDLQLGYAVTTHRGQGTTIDTAYLLVGGRMQDLHLSLVQATRAKSATHIYTDRHEAGDKLSRLAEQMSKEREKTLAHELAERAMKEEQRQRHNINIRQEMRI